MQLQINLLKDLLDKSFKEDFGTKGDITSNAILDKKVKTRFFIKSRQSATLCGIDIARYYLDNYSTAQYMIHKHDSDVLQAGDTIISGEGNAKEVLLIERIVLNYMQHLTGVATFTNQFVKRTLGTKAKILDTRKTIPMIRLLQKYAVTCGGGYNHRLTLDSGIMIKDNHIEICGSVAKAIQKAKNNTPHYTKIEIECDTIKQVREALIEKVDIILLDNMSIEQIRQCVNIVRGQIITEASGNISLETVESIAKTGVNYISIGKITHSAQSIDIGMDIKRAV